MISSGVGISLWLFLGLIPWVADGQVNHQQTGLAPFKFLGLKAAMLVGLICL